MRVKLSGRWFVSNFLVGFSLFLIAQPVYATAPIDDPELDEGPPVPMQGGPVPMRRPPAPAWRSPTPAPYSQVPSQQSRPISIPNTPHFVQTGPMPTQLQPSPAKPLNHIQNARIAHGRLEIVAQPNFPLRIKEPFVLSNPKRLVLDIIDAKLEATGLPFLPETIGDVPVHSIRFGQFTEDTVRVVIETPEPERLRVALDRNSLAVSATRGRSFIGSLYNTLFRQSRPSSPPPQVAQQQPPRTLPPPPPISVSSAMSSFPHLENLRKLQMEQLNHMPDSGQRFKVIDIARAQLGLSKDVNRDYINQTFSKGRDNSWCADFVSTVLEWAGGSPWGHLSRVEDIYQWGVANGRVTSLPAPANLVVFTYGSGSFDHIAFVESINPDQTITTIGGNEGYAASGNRTSGSVARSIYKLNDKRILGFVNPIKTADNLGLPSPPEVSRIQF